MFRLHLLAACAAVFVGHAAINRSVADEPASGSPPAGLDAAAQSSAAETSTPPPAEVDLRPEFLALELPPRRQGRRNTCSVFTTAAAMEFALSKQSGRSFPLSVEYLNWSCNQVIDNQTADRGQFFHHLLEGFARHGVCREEQMPYTRRFDPELAPSDEAKAAAAEVRDMGLTVHWIKPINRRNPGLNDEQFDEARRVLAAGWPVAAGASHSRLLVGYRDDAEAAGGGVFYTKDSGSGRFAEVTYEFARNDINDAFWVAPPRPSADETPAAN